MSTMRASDMLDSSVTEELTTMVTSLKSIASKCDSEAVNLRLAIEKAISLLSEVYTDPKRVILASPNFLIEDSSVVLVWEKGGDSRSFSMSTVRISADSVELSYVADHSTAKNIAPFITSAYTKAYMVPPSKVDKISSPMPTEDQIVGSVSSYKEKITIDSPNFAPVGPTPTKIADPDKPSSLKDALKKFMGK